uniref:AlNc14C196G8563 protein n=1 Tax=Albugo laibachii Nc14 TaxID=890382 RepID=F0WQ82_9STRA|nr:AlNc14C196G8563 [Albugo laibachii Nc14]|eukprot:CCA23488.1 AlNc14C196G8563 [Albugo laibachii Nc14]
MRVIEGYQLFDRRFVYRIIVKFLHAFGSIEINIRIMTGQDGIVDEGSGSYFSALVSELQLAWTLSGKGLCGKILYFSPPFKTAS